MKLFTKILFLAVLNSSPQSWSQQLPTVSERLYGLFAEYNQRFTAGVYVANPVLAENFILAQAKLMQSFISEGHLNNVLIVENDFDPSLTIELFALTDENKNLLGFYYSKSNYYDREEESYLRFKTLTEVVSGLGFVPVGGQHAVTIKGFHLRPAESATLQFSYLKNLRQGTMGVLNLFIIKKNSSWALYSENYMFTSRLYVKTWKTIFPPNGGVTELVLR